VVVPKLKDQFKKAKRPAEDDEEVEMAEKKAKKNKKVKTE
jgi:hypothetical protein